MIKTEREQKRVCTLKVTKSAVRSEVIWYMKLAGHSVEQINFAGKKIAELMITQSDGWWKDRGDTMCLRNWVIFLMGFQNEQKAS